MFLRTPGGGLSPVTSPVGSNENPITLSSLGTSVSSCEMHCSNATWRARCALGLSATIPAALSFVLVIIGILQAVSCRCPLFTSQSWAPADGFWPPVAHQSPINNLSPPKLHNCRPRRPTRIPSVGLRQECEQLQRPGQAPKSRGRAQYRLNLRRAPTQSFKKRDAIGRPEFHRSVG